MAIGRDRLKRNYSAKSDDELLDLHALGTLTELAYDVLEAELRTRGLPIPTGSEDGENTSKESSTAGVTTAAKPVKFGQRLFNAAKYGVYGTLFVSFLFLVPLRGSDRNILGFGVLESGMYFRLFFGVWGVFTLICLWVSPKVEGGGDGGSGGG